MKDVFIKFTRTDGSVYDVSTFEYYYGDPDAYQDTADVTNLYKRVYDTSSGWEYVPIT